MKNIVVSLVIPAMNEEESLSQLFEEIQLSCDAHWKEQYEVLVIDDGSRDETWAKIEELKKKYDFIRAWRFLHNCGKATALNLAFGKTKGKYVVTLDADLQDDPKEIPEMIALLESKNLDLVSGWKQKRHDPWHKTMPSKVFNSVVSLVAGQKLHDFNCGLKAYRSEVVKSLDLYGDYHRFIPLMASWMGFKIGEKVVQHRARIYGVSKYGWTRLFSGFLDLVSLLFIRMYSTKPLHLFGILGLLFLLLGMSTSMYFLGLWIIEGALHIRPLFVGGLVSIVVGMLFVGFGLIGEMLIRYGNRSRLPMGEVIDS